MTLEVRFLHFAVCRVHIREVRFSSPFAPIYSTLVKNQGVFHLFGQPICNCDPERIYLNARIGELRGVIITRFSIGVVYLSRCSASFAQLINTFHSVPSKLFTHLGRIR